ncbi:hypothetical protein MRX96_031732 [Rhipicephalus microplus]
MFHMTSDCLLTVCVMAAEASEDGRSTTEDVSDVDICASSTSVTSSIDGRGVWMCVLTQDSRDDEQLDVMTARIRALESEVKKKAEEVELNKFSLYKAEGALEIAAQARSQLEKRLSQKVFC